MFIAVLNDTLEGGVKRGEVCDKCEVCCDVMKHTDGQMLSSCSFDTAVILTSL